MQLYARVRPREEFKVTPENVWAELEKFDITEKVRYLRGELQIETFHRYNPTCIIAIWSKYLKHDYVRYVKNLEFLENFIKILQQNYNKALQDYLSKNPRYINNQVLGSSRRIKIDYPHWEGMIDLVVSKPWYIEVNGKSYEINQTSLYRLPISFLLDSKRELYKLYIHTIQGFVGRYRSTIWTIEMLLLQRALFKTMEEIELETYIQDPNYNVHLLRNRARKYDKHVLLPEIFVRSLNDPNSHELSVVNSFYYPAIGSDERLKYHTIRPEAKYISDRGYIEFLEVRTGNLADDFYGPTIQVKFYQLKP